MQDKENMLYLDNRLYNHICRDKNKFMKFDEAISMRLRWKIVLWHYGIKRLLTMPWSPQQNDMVKRKNKSILNMARSMLQTKKMPKEFWAKAMDYAIYLSNRYPTKSLDSMTPQETWSGRKPSVSHLKVFGTIDYVHVYDQVRTKLDDKSKKMIFMGYDQKKGYKHYNPNEGKIMISRDFEFNEEGTWDWKVDGEKYNFLPVLNEEEKRYKDHQEPIVTPRTYSYTPIYTNELNFSFFFLVESQVMALDQERWWALRTYMR